MLRTMCCVVGFVAFCGVLGAEENRPNTDWFQQAGLGVFVHYLEGLQNNPETLHSLAVAVVRADAFKFPIIAQESLCRGRQIFAFVAARLFRADFF